jgi:hypothetical protein
MIIKNIRMRYSGRVPGTMGHLSQREWNEIVRETWEEVGLYWHEHILPKHFTAAGGKEYDYAPRSGDNMSGKAFWRSYQGRKQKYKGHRRPLEWSGDLIKDCRTFRVTGTATSHGSRLRVYLSNAQKANFKNKFSDPRLNMAEELTRVSQEDRDTLTYMFNRIMEGKLGDDRYVSYVTVFHEG